MLGVLKAYTRQLAEGKAYAIERETSPPLIQEFFTMAEQKKEKELIQARVDRKKEKIKIIKDKTLPIDRETFQEVKSSVNNFLKDNYGFLKVKDIVFRIAGTGSLGVKRYAVLVRLQYALARFIGTVPVGEDTFILKQLQPTSQKIDHTLYNKKMKNVETVMTAMAQALGSAQIRSASRKGSADVDSLMKFSLQSLWQTNLIQLAVDYTSVMKGYFKEYQKLFKKGKMNM